MSSHNIFVVCHFSVESLIIEHPVNLDKPVWCSLLWQYNLFHIKSTQEWNVFLYSHITKFNTALQNGALAFFEN